MPSGAVPSASLARYRVATRARGGRFGDRTAREAGHSVEFLDYRPYQPGDDPRTVDWRVYARTGRAYTRLYHAERSTRLELIVDDSPSMRLHGKDRWAARLARVLLAAGAHEATAVLRFAGSGASVPVRSQRDVPAAWRALDRYAEAGSTDVAADPPETDRSRPHDDLPQLLAGRVLGLPRHDGAALVVVVSDLLDPGAWRPLHAAAHARRCDLMLLQTLHGSELEPDAGDVELVDVEDGSTLEVGADEARAYREAVRRFVAGVAASTAEAGFRHRLLRVPEAAVPAAAERVRPWRRRSAAPTGEGVRDGDARDGDAFRALVRHGVLVRR